MAGGAPGWKLGASRGTREKRSGLCCGAKVKYSGDRGHILSIYVGCTDSCNRCYASTYCRQRHTVSYNSSLLSIFCSVSYEITQQAESPSRGCGTAVPACTLHAAQQRDNCIFVFVCTLVFGKQNGWLFCMGDLLYRCCVHPSVCAGSLLFSGCLLSPLSGCCSVSLALSLSHGTFLTCKGYYKQVYVALARCPFGCLWQSHYHVELSRF